MTQHMGERLVALYLDTAYQYVREFPYRFGYVRAGQYIAKTHAYARLIDDLDVRERALYLVEAADRVIADSSY